MSVSSCYLEGRRYSPQYTLILEEGTKWRGLTLDWLTIQVLRTEEGWVTASVQLYSSSKCVPPVFKFNETHSALLQELFHMFRRGLTHPSVGRLHLDVLMKRFQEVQRLATSPAERISVTPPCWMMGHRPVAIVAPVRHRNETASNSFTFL